MDVATDLPVRFADHVLGTIARRLTAQGTPLAVVRLPDGRQVVVPEGLLAETEDGLALPFEAGQLALSGLTGDAGVQELVIPLVAERAEVLKSLQDTAVVRLTKRTVSHAEPVDVELRQEEIVVERVPVGEVVEQTSGPRNEGDTLIVPVFEEVLVVSKRLVLREEVRIHRRVSSKHEQTTLELRRELVDVDRLPIPPVVKP